MSLNAQKDFFAAELCLLLLALQVIFAADEKRDTDAIYAAGWNCKVGMG